jgi:uncharacterized protein (TIGR00251 family)
MEPRPLRLQVRVVPGAKSSAVGGRHGEGWKLRVTAPPERGRANRAVVELLSQCLGVAPRDVSIVSGVSGRDKIVELRGISPEEAERRLGGRTRTS